MASRNTLYLVKPDQQLIPISPGAPANEDELQLLIGRYPNLIGDEDDGLLLVQREHGIPDGEDALDRWSVDHLFVSRKAVPVLVEVKRAVDTRIRREVVGQMLDYAANGVAYWPAGSLRAKFEAGCASHDKDPEAELVDFLGTDRDAAAFWSSVDDNLRAGRVTLVFVADAIPVELRRVVEFLNDQMRADVRAIELQYFASPDGSRLIAPKIYGETERSKAEKAGPKPKLEALSIEQWIEKNLSPWGSNVVEGATIVLQMMKQWSDEVGVASTQGSIFSRVSGPEGRSSYPVFITIQGRCQIAFGYLAGSPQLASPEKKQDFYDRFTEAVGALSTRNFQSGFPSFPLQRLLDPGTKDAFGATLEAYYLACRAAV